MGPMIMPPPMPSIPDITPAPTAATDNSAQVRAVHGMSPSANAYPSATLRWCPRWLRPAKCKSVDVSKQLSGGVSHAVHAHLPTYSSCSRYSRYWLTWY